MTCDLTEAAARLRRLKAGETMAAVYGIDDPKAWKGAASRMADEATLADAYLASSPADDAEAIGGRGIQEGGVMSDIIDRLKEARERLATAIVTMPIPAIDPVFYTRLLADAEASIGWLRATVAACEKSDAILKDVIEKNKAEIDRLGVELTRANMRISELQEKHNGS